MCGWRTHAASARESMPHVLIAAPVGRAVEKVLSSNGTFPENDPRRATTPQSPSDAGPGCCFSLSSFSPTSPLTCGNPSCCASPWLGTSGRFSIINDSAALAIKCALIGAVMNRNTVISNSRGCGSTPRKQVVAHRGQQHAAHAQCAGLGRCMQALEKIRQLHQAEGADQDEERARQQQGAEQVFGQGDHSTMLRRNTYLLSTTVLPKPSIAMTNAASK